MNLAEILIKAAADTIKAGANVTAQNSTPTRRKNQASSCTPCAAHAYVQKIKASIPGRK